MKPNQSSAVKSLPPSLTSADVPADLMTDRKIIGYHGWTTVSAYVSLLKIRSATLNSLSGLVGMLLAAGGGVSWSTAFVLFTAGWLAAAGSGALNSYIDRDIDKVMLRTSHRPLPVGTIKPAKKALYFGILLVSSGLIISAIGLNALTTLFIAAGVTIYVFVYTMWLKRKTPWSVIIGGLAGNCALLAGWFSVATDFTLAALLFNIFIFLWTPGHFWGLALKTKDDGERANIPTFPAIYGERVASKWTALSNMVLIPVSITPYFLGILGEAYLFISVIIGLVVLVANIKLYFTPTGERAWTTFKLSSLYLAVVYLAVAIDILLV